MQPFCDVIGFFNQGHGLFQYILLREKIFLIFFFLPFFSMKDCYEIEINIFSVQNIASVSFQTVCCSTRSSPQPKVRKIS